MLLCPRCQRSHPDEAAFCFFDGARLREEGQGVPAAATSAETLARLPFDFVFSWGLRCRSYDELVQGCQQDWPAARVLFEQGALRQYLTSAGRFDLAQAHDEISAQCLDPDVALANFLSRLPALKPLRPELELQPRKLLLDPMPPNETRSVELGVLNIGSGLLHGLVQLEEAGDWLRFAGGTTHCDIKTTDQQSVLLEVRTQDLAAPQSLAARLTVITNGGVVEVPVRLEVTARPFPHEPLAGAVSPRELAARMRDNPKPAATLLESGAVARWFESNCWDYPIAGPTASGMAAVQQFFEALKLTRPPSVSIQPAEVRIDCTYPEAVTAEATLHSPERKWVYGQVSAAAPWVRVLTPRVSGPQKATIRFEVETAALEPDRRHEASIEVMANGGQQFWLPIKLEVRRPVRPWRGRVLQLLALGALGGLLLRLGLIEPVLRLIADAGPEAFPRHFVLATSWLGATAGLFMVSWRPGWRWGDLAAGLLAGGAGGVMAAATLACALPFLDAGPRLLLAGVPALAAVAISWALGGALVAGLGIRLTTR